MTRFLSGHGPLYKPVDYTQLAAITKIKRSQGDRALKKVEKLAQVSKNSKELAMLQEHKRIWENEMHKLKQTEQKVQNELDLLRPATPNFQTSTTSLEELYEDVVDYEDTLRYDTQLFTQNTLQPVLDLRDDMQVWLKENRDQLILGVRNMNHANKVKEILDSVKQQQTLVLNQLDEELYLVDQDLHDFIESIGFNIFDLQLPNIRVGVPDDLIQLECPDDDLKTSCLKQFEDQDEKYAICIESLEEKYRDVIDR